MCVCVCVQYQSHISHMLYTLVYTHLQAVDFNIFEGMAVHGLPVVVISQGRLCVQNGKVSEFKSMN